VRQPDPKPGRTPVAPHALSQLHLASRQHVDYVDVWPWLEQRLQQRVDEGYAKYGTPLETHNGRDALWDAWAEAADLVQYLTQEQLEHVTAPVGDLLRDACRLLLRLSRILWERDRMELDRLTQLPDGLDQEIIGPRHDPSKWKGDWCDCERCTKAARQGFQRNSEPE